MADPAAGAALAADTYGKGLGLDVEGPDGAAPGAAEADRQRRHEGERAVHADRRLPGQDRRRHRRARHPDRGGRPVRHEPAVRDLRRRPEPDQEQLSMTSPVQAQDVGVVPPSPAPAARLLATRDPAGAPQAATGLNLQGLSKTFTLGRNQVHALAPTDLGTAQGTFLSFLGPSGCGKSTVLRILAGSGGAHRGHGADQRHVDRRDAAGAPPRASRSRTRPCCPGGPWRATSGCRSRWPGSARSRG